VDRARFDLVDVKLGRPMETITLDSYAASYRGVREMKTDGLLPENTKERSSKYLNNLVDQVHRHIKSRTNAMLGFKRFKNASTAISGIESMHCICKRQFDLPPSASRASLRSRSRMLFC
jgi:transposase-like protein